MSECLQCLGTLKSPCIGHYWLCPWSTTQWSLESHKGFECPGRFWVPLGSPGPFGSPFSPGFNKNLLGPQGPLWIYLHGYLRSPQDLFGVHIFFNNTQDFDKFTNIFPVLEYSKTHKFSNCMGSFLSENACDVMSKHPHKNTLWKTRNYYNDNNLDIRFGN